MAKDRMRATLSIATLMLFAATAALWSAAPVLAHARYKSSTPAKGAIVPVAPSAVEIVFTNDIQKIAGSYDIAVNKDRGPSVTDGPAVIDDADRSKLSVALKPRLDPGRYVVNWKNVSDEDGDPAEGAFSFYVGDYTPNAVDLANDAQLERVGAEEETPDAGDTPTSSDDTPAAGPTTAATPGAVLTVTNGAESDEGDGGNNNVIWIVAAAIGAGVIAAIAAFAVMRRRS